MGAPLTQALPEVAPQLVRKAVVLGGTAQEPRIRIHPNNPLTWATVRPRSSSWMRSIGSPWVTWPSAATAKYQPGRPAFMKRLTMAGSPKRIPSL